MGVGLVRYYGMIFIFIFEKTLYLELLAIKLLLILQDFIEFFVLEGKNLHILLPYASRVLGTG